MHEDLSKRTTPEQSADQALNAMHRSRAMYESVAQAAGFRLELGEKTCFDHTRNTVTIGVAQLEKLGITDQALKDFIVLHEIGHFIEYGQDPEGYLSVVERTKARPSPDGKLYFDLYNCLQDIYVNRNTANSAPEYRDIRGGFSEKVEQLYSQIGFKERDFTDRPLCVQYAQYLLNLGMGVGDDITLSPEVKAEIDAGAFLYGQHYTYAEFIENFLIPVVGYQRDVGWTATMSQRSAVIEAAIVPVFDKLLQKDKENQQELEEAGGEVNPLGDMEPTLEDLEKSIEKAIKDKQEKNLSPKERATRLRAEQAKEVAEKAGLSEGQTGDFAESLERVQPLIHEIVSTFKELRSPQSSWRQQSLGPYTKGNRLDIPSVIQNFSDVLHNPAEARIFYKDAQQEEVVYLPKKIRLLVIADLSVSMANNEEDLQDATLALAVSMATLCQEHELTDSHLRGELGVIGFGGDAELLLAPTESATLENIARIFPRITADKGGTADHLALEIADEQIRRARAHEKRGDTVDIVVEITDGDTADPTATRQCLRELEELGAIVGAVKIEEGGHEGETFEEIWNEHREKPRGHYIRTPKNLGRAIQKILYDAIQHSKENL